VYVVAVIVVEEEDIGVASGGCEEESTRLINVDLTSGFMDCCEKGVGSLACKGCGVLGWMGVLGVVGWPRGVDGGGGGSRVFGRWEDARLGGLGIGSGLVEMTFEHGDGGGAVGSDLLGG
jgi:hypothetical protein